MKDRLYQAVTIVSMVTMPAAAAINFGDAAFDALNGRTHFYLALVGGLFTGIGFETIGIVAGHRAVSFYSRQDRRWIAAGLALLAYIIIGVWEMFDIPFARFVPILSGLVYILAGLQSEAESENHADNEQVAWQREQEAKDRQFQQQLEVKRLEADTAVKLARVEAKARETKPKPVTETAKPVTETSKVAVNLDELTGNKMQIYTLFRQKPGASNTEIAESLGVSRQYVGQVKKELNGYLK